MAKGSRWEGAHWNVMGDSITEGNEYAELVKEILKIKAVHNYGISGTCLASVSETDSESMAYRIGQMDTPADLITVFGGTNDWGNDGGKPLGTMGDTTPLTVYGAIDTIITTVLRDFPKARLAFFTPLQRNSDGPGPGSGWSETVVNGEGVHLKEIADAIKEVCEKYAVPVLDLYRTSGITDINMEYFLYDGLHPSQAGYERISTQIASFLDSL